MKGIVEKQIKNEICKFNETLFHLIKGIDGTLDLDEDTLTIIENSNKLLIFCAVKNLQNKKIGDPVCVIYNEDAKAKPILFGRSLAQYRKIYEKSSGQCHTINRKATEAFLPDEKIWSYSFMDYVIYQNSDGSYGLCHNDFA